MKRINEEFESMQEFVDYKTIHNELKEAGLWQRETDNGKVYAQFLIME